MRKKLHSYRGMLSPAQVAAGMNAAQQNARRLARDAATLLEGGSFATAASLAILSIEEAGKVSILRTLALAKSDKEAAETWNGYRSHTRKNVAWLLPQLAAEGARKLDDFRPLFDNDAEHPFILDQLKQVGFYTDCLGSAHWSIPSEVIDESLARMLFGISQLFARDSEHTEREVQLWIDHVGPVWKKDMGWMKQAVINWYTAMQAAGLAPEGTNGMEEFIRHGIQPKQV